MSGYKPDYWDGVRTGENDGEEPWPPLPTPESIYRGTCADGDRCLHGCHRSEACYYVASSPGEREYKSWACGVKGEERG